jgi:hypothetical protein
MFFSAMVHLSKNRKPCRAAGLIRGIPDSLGCDSDGVERMQDQVASEENRSPLNVTDHKVNDIMTTTR